MEAIVFEQMRKLRITNKTQLQELARRLKVRPDWHEPDEQDVEASVYGTKLDNAGHDFVNPLGCITGEDSITNSTSFRLPINIPYEMNVFIKQGEQVVGIINLATLLAIACEK